MKRGVWVAALAFVLLGVAASAHAGPYIWAQSVTERIAGSGVSADRNCSSAVLGAPGAAAPTDCQPFLSLGLDNNGDGLGGWVVLDFNTMFTQAAVVFETTNNCVPTGNGCRDYQEAADVYVSVDSSSFAAPAGWTRVGTILNDAAQPNNGAVTLLVGGPFRYLAVVDTTKAHFATPPSTDGFDLNAVGVTPVPEPASLSLLGLGLAGIARAVRRRKQS